MSPVCSERANEHGVQGSARRDCLKRVVQKSFLRVCAARAGAQVHQHAGENWEGEHPQEPVNGAAATNADDGLPLAALEQSDDNDKCPQTEQQKEARPGNLALPLDDS